MAAELLRDLAEKTADAPEPHGTGRYHYVHTKGAHLRTNRYLERSGASTITGSVEPFEREQWIAEDGSGRILVAKDGRPVQPSGDYGPGELPAPFTTRPVPGAAPEVMKAFVAIWSTQVVTPELQRLLLLNLAECAGLATETRESGVAVAYVDRTRHHKHLLVFDEDTGALIYTEGTALEGARLPIPVPAVTSHTTWLESSYRETLG